MENAKALAIGVPLNCEARRTVPKLFFLPLLFASFAALAEPGYATRELELRAEPLAGAAVTGKVAKGARFEIVAEQKAWSRVRAGETEGWTLSFFVMKGAPAAEVGLGQRLSEVISLGTERRAETTATIGVRGLDEEQLRGAQFNAPELQHLESLRVSKTEGEQFARRGGLQPQVGDYLAPLSQ